MDNALLYAEAREAQLRTERLQAVTAAALSRAVSAEKVAEVVMREGLHASRRGARRRPSRSGEDGTAVLGSFGYTPETHRVLPDA